MLTNSQRGARKAAEDLLLQQAIGGYGAAVMRAIRWRDTLFYVVVGSLTGTLGFIIARLHLHIFDKLYLFHGRAAKFLK